MVLARDAAPEIDRLVLSVNRRVGPEHGARLNQLAEAVGLDSLMLLPHFEGFLQAGTLTRELATLRMRYWPPDQVLDRLDELVRKGLAASTDTGLQATEALRPLLAAMLAARADVAASALGGHEDDVTAVSAYARIVMDAASDDHVVAVAHRRLPEPEDPFLLVEDRLMGLRYIRQHDHAEAWLRRGLTAAQMVVFTRLWHGEEPGADIAELVDAGFAIDDPARLTPDGLRVREAIEAETDRRAQQTFDVLDAEAGHAFLSALRRLSRALD